MSRRAPSPLPPATTITTLSSLAFSSSHRCTFCFPLHPIAATSRFFFIPPLLPLTSSSHRCHLPLLLHPTAATYRFFFIPLMPPLTSSRWNRDTTRGRENEREREGWRMRKRKRMRGRELISQEPPQWKLKPLRLTHHTHSLLRTLYFTDSTSLACTTQLQRGVCRYLRRQSYLVIPSRTDADAC